jgi:hypothetical protein
MMGARMPSRLLWIVFDYDFIFIFSIINDNNHGIYLLSVQTLLVLLKGVAMTLSLCRWIDGAHTNISSLLKKTQSSNDWSFSFGNKCEKKLEIFSFSSRRLILMSISHASTAAVRLRCFKVRGYHNFNYV